MVYVLSGVQKLTSPTRIPQHVSPAAITAGHVRVHLEGDPHTRRLLPAPGLLQRLRGRPLGVSHGEALSVLRRSRYFDHALTRFLDTPLHGQIVLLEGRYDSRPWRFEDELAGRPIFAVADAETPGRIRVSPTEPLSTALRAAGCASGERSLFIWEGGAMFQTRAAVKATLSAIKAASGPGSLLVMDAWCGSERGLPRHLGQHLRFSIHPEDLTGLLARMGFEVIDVADTEELVRRFPPEGATGSLGDFCVTARLAGL
jgi:O-methyltransferase involved in polyketide biosynthesis